MTHLTAPQLLVSARLPLGEYQPEKGRCYFCGGDIYDGIPIKGNIKSTFSDFASCHVTATHVCSACRWFTLTDKNPDLTAWLGKENLQSPRTYSHFYHNEEWLIFSKAHKEQMAGILLGDVMPQVAIIADSGQKHLSFEARVNPPMTRAGWVLFEKRLVWIDQDDFREMFGHVQAMYWAEYTKDAILTGNYQLTGKHSDDVAILLKHEPYLKTVRGQTALELAVWLVTLPEHIKQARKEKYSGKKS